MADRYIEGLSLQGSKPHGKTTRYVIGADIGGTSLRLGLADGSGAMVGKWSASTRGSRHPREVVQLMRTGVDALLRDASIPAQLLQAMGVGAPGITNADEGVVIATSYLMGWRDVPLRDLLEAEFLMPVGIDNDVNLAAQGELSAGAARGADDFVFLAIGTGIGAGIVLNRQLHRGKIWTAGEIGYMLVPGTSEEPVERGKPGALEEIVGGQGIESQWQRRWSREATPYGREATATEILDYAVKGDALGQEILRISARTLAYAIYNMSLVLNCPLFVLGGSVGQHPALGPAVQTVLAERSARVQPVLIPSALGTEAQLTGAVFLALETGMKKMVLTEG